MVMDKQAAAAQAWTSMFAGLSLSAAVRAVTVDAGHSAAARCSSRERRLTHPQRRALHRKAVANARRLARTKLR